MPFESMTIAPFDVGVDREERLGDEAVDRGRVDQRAATAAEHVRDRVPAAVDAALDVDVEGPVDDLVGHLVEHAREVDAGVVEGDVQPAPALDGVVGVRPSPAAASETSAADRERLLADVRRRRLDRVAVDVDARDPGALLGEADRGGPSDPGPAPVTMRTLPASRSPIAPSSSATRVAACARHAVDIDPGAVLTARIRERSRGGRDRSAIVVARKEGFGGWPHRPRERIQDTRAASPAGVCPGAPPGDEDVLELRGLVHDHLDPVGLPDAVRVRA